MQQKGWTSIISSPDFDPREGQQDLWDVAFEDSIRSIVCSHPTGYGKTHGACGCYVIHRELKRVNKFFWVTHGDGLREQTALDIKKCFVDLGFGFPEIRLVDGADGLEGIERSIEKKRHETFVTSYQIVLNNMKFFGEIFRLADFFCVFDEWHRCNVENRSSDCIKLKGFERRLLLSATPIGSGGKELEGVEYETVSGNRVPKIHSLVTPKEAILQGAIRPPEGQQNHYNIHAYDKSGSRVEITTQQLSNDGVGDFETYEIKQQLRYDQEYLSPLITDSLDRLNQQSILHPDQHQVIVFCMTNRHAEFVSSQYNVWNPGCADWIGVKRSDEENKKVKKNFDDNRLKVLCQVDKLGEGYDNKQANILVFLHLIRAPRKLMQQLGRGLRRNYNVPLSEDIAYIFAGSDTPVAKLIDQLCVEIGCKLPNEKTMDKIGGNDDWIADISPWIENVQLYQREKIDTHTKRDIQPSDRDILIAKRLGKNPVDVAEIRLALAEEELQRENVLSEDQKKEIAKIQVDQALSKLVGNVLRIISKDCEMDRGRAAGFIKKSIHGQWNKSENLSHGIMFSEEMFRKHRWIKEINDRIKSLRFEGIPEWLKEKLYDRGYLKGVH